MASGGISATADDKFTCPICFEIILQPTEIPCGHSFCKDCISSNIGVNSAAPCPICRTSYKSDQMTNNLHLAKQIQTTKQPCPDCKEMCQISKLKDHCKFCPKRGSHTNVVTPLFRPAAPTSQPIPSVANRSTFKCPYCGQQNLDTEMLVAHANTNHKHETKAVVCPVCSSMPWGNPEQQSGNFLHHLNLRHKFDYQTFVDFNQDEEEIFQSVLAKSMKEK